MSRFIPIDRNTQFLLPPSMDDWLPENHLARFIVEVIDGLDISALVKPYAGRGSKAHHPASLLAILVYGYATGTFSSRKLERATYDSVAFRFIAAGTHPDHDTLASFRRRFLTEIEGLFTQVLTLAAEMKLLKLGTVCLDGTKIKANASRHSALSHGHIEKLETQLKLEVQELMALAEQADRADIPDGVSLPEELNRRETRLAAMANAKTQIAQRAKERHAKELAEHAQKLAARAEKERVTGKKPRSKPPVEPIFEIKPCDQINLTDAESRIMPVSGGGYEQAYNAQACVDASSMLVVAAGVTQATNDRQQLTPILTTLTTQAVTQGAVTHLVADTGYFSARNVDACEAQAIEPLIAVIRENHHPHWRERHAEPAPLAKNSTPTQTMAHRLQTATGRSLYALRKQTVEPVFGIIKSVLGFRQFSLRGLSKVKGEWSLVCLAWNLKRMAALRLKIG